MKRRKGYADGPFGQIHYQEAGSGTPLLLLHQSPSSSEMFEAAYPRLAARGIRAIGIDTPGFGQSHVPDQPPSIADYANAIRSVIDHLKLDRAALLGHHTGASIAAELAVMEPQRVTRVVLNGAPLLTAEEQAEWREALKKHPEMPPQADGSHLMDIWNRRLRFTPGWTSLRAMHWGVVQMLIAGENAKLGHAAAFSHDLSKPLRGIIQPTLVLTNTGDDIYKECRRVLTLRPDFEYAELQGGTHDIIDEQPEEWTRIVADFVLRG
ncbi:MAG: alpha/beta hydrolase [Gammaproteobacteria bacterium]|nr:alpha/beta hydrolase [Gammaproteobacteria bacterium]